jgi:hypothetical protein
MILMQLSISLLIEGLVLLSNIAYNVAWLYHQVTVVEVVRCLAIPPQLLQRLYISLRGECMQHFLHNQRPKMVFPARISSHPR